MVHVARVAAAALSIGLTAASVGSDARADWEVKRTEDGALVRQAAHALAARPDDRALAARLVRLAGKQRLAALLAKFEARANAAPGNYNTATAYAQLLLAAGKFEEAAARFGAVAQAHPATAAAQRGHAAALAAAGRREDAAAAYRTALAHARLPGERRGILLALLAISSLPEEIERELEVRRALLALETPPGSDATAEDLAAALDRAGRPREAADLLEPRIRRARATSRGDAPCGEVRCARLVLRTQELREAAGQDDAAARLLEDLERGLPRGAADLRREVYRRSIELGRRRDTLPALVTRLSDGARRPGLVEWEALSRVRDELGDPDGALEAARRALALAPRNVELGQRVLALAGRLGREDEVVAAYEHLTRIAPGDPRFLVELIERKLRRHERDHARALFDRAQKRFHHAPEALARLAEVATRWSEDNRALALWKRAHQLAPHDETAILGLGEAHFQRGRVDLAVQTWRQLASLAGRDKARGLTRLAQVLVEHDLLDEAAAQARAAIALSPKEPRHRRALAQVFERQRKTDAAVEQWQAVCDLARGEDRAAERREARSRILTLLARDRRGGLHEILRSLEAKVRDAPGDREVVLFLAEAYVRNGRPERAADALRGLADTRPGDAEVAQALARLLRQLRQPDEAIKRLETLARHTPARARDVHVQIADIELGRYDDRRALLHAEEAQTLAPDDPKVLAKVAAVRERSGHTDEAIATYRRALSRGGDDPQAAFALARLLLRRGAPDESAEVLRAVLRDAADEEIVADAARRAIDLEEYLGTLPELERMMANLGGLSAQVGGSRRRVLVEVFRRLVPALYRAAPGDAAAARDRARIAQHGLRPLLELVTDPDAEPEAAVVELLGMLGNGDAAPVLAKLAAAAATKPPTASPPVSPAGASASRPAGVAAAPVHAKLAVQMGAVIALGRLADARGRAPLEDLLAVPDAGLQAAVLWALGRIGHLESADGLLRHVHHSRSELAALACLGVGRILGRLTSDHAARHERLAAALQETAADLSRPARVRRAATLGLGLSGDVSAVPALVRVLDQSDAVLAHAAAAALAALGGRQVLPSLVQRVLLARGPAAAAAVEAFDRFAAQAPLGDEARVIEGARLDVDAMLTALAEPPVSRAAGGDRAALWLDRIRQVQDLVAGGLTRHRDLRVRILAALDARDDGPGLGPLAPTGSDAMDAATAAALREVSESARDRVVALLDDPDSETRRLALRVAAKLRDPRMTPARIAAALADPGPGFGEAAALAARWHVRTQPASASDIAAAAATMLADAEAHWDRRLAAVRLLAGIGAAAGPSLEAALADVNPIVRAAAAQALGGHPAATPALVAAAADPIAGVRAAVAASLRGRPTPQAVDALNGLQQDENPRVRAAAGGG